MASPSVARFFDVRMLGRHQVAASLGTIADFGTMIALVELSGIRAPFAALLGALGGAITNFLLGRLWAFRPKQSGSFEEQALRYAAVSAGGAVLNGGLLAIVLALSTSPYLYARGIISAVVSVAYSYPMQARFVFRAVEPT